MQFARYDSRDPLLQVIETSPNYSPTGAARLGRRSFESDLVSNW